MLSNSILENFFFDMFFRELEAELSPLTDSNNQFELFHSTHIVEQNYSVVDSNT